MSWQNVFVFIFILKPKVGVMDNFFLRQIVEMVLHTSRPRAFSSVWNLRNVLSAVGARRYDIHSHIADCLSKYVRSDMFSYLLYYIIKHQASLIKSSAIEISKFFSYSDVRNISLSCTCTYMPRLFIGKWYNAASLSIVWFWKLANQQKYQMWVFQHMNIE